jgi:hypothetical protein
VKALSAVSPKPLCLVTLAAWIEHIRTFNPEPKEVPATKLLDFYQQQQEIGQTAALACDKSVSLASELAMGPISDELVEKYVLYQRERADKS